MKIPVNNSGLYIYIYIYMCVCVCVCVCARELFNLLGEFY